MHVQVPSTKPDIYRHDRWTEELNLSRNGGFMIKQNWRRELRFLIPCSGMLRICAACRVWRPKSLSNVRFCLPQQYKSFQGHYSGLYCHWPVNNCLLPAPVSAHLKRKLYQRREYKFICFLKVGVEKVPKGEITKVKRRLSLPNPRLKRLLV